MTTCSQRLRGSPPPMRGKDRQLVTVYAVLWITPAYAGKRLTLHKIWQTVRDHPRLCGEKLTQEIGDGSYPGSPPPMRGKVASFCANVSTYRITPAYAGKSDYRRGVFSSGRDHPRLCGEKHLIRFWFTIHIGITPAYAGKRSRICRYSRRT